MTEDGHEFFVSANGVWLTDEVPAQYLARHVSPACRSSGT
jgi:RNA:NAD 2'-phosphotransferase (TPT1/KptA family)